MTASDCDQENTPENTPAATPEDEETCLCCQKQFTRRDTCVQCFLCELWSHTKCSGLSAECMKVLGSKKNEGVSWTCRACKSFAVKYSKANLQIETRLKNLEERLDSVEKLKENMEELDRKFENLKAAPPTDDANTVFEELRERDSRKENLLIYDLPEPQANSGDQRKEMDRNRAKDVLGKLNVRVQDEDLKFMTRLGRYDENKTRPALIGIPNSNLRERILSKAYQLNSMNEPYNSLRITRDLTKKQREEENNLKTEAEKRNEEMPEEEKKNFQWKVVGKRGERRLLRSRLQEDGEGRGGFHHQRPTFQRGEGRQDTHRREGNWIRDQWSGGAAAHPHSDVNLDRPVRTNWGVQQRGRRY